MKISRNLLTLASLLMIGSTFAASEAPKKDTKKKRVSFATGVKDPVQDVKNAAAAIEKQVVRRYDPFTNAEMAFIVSSLRKYKQDPERYFNSSSQKDQAEFINHANNHINMRLGLTKEQ